MIYPAARLTEFAHLFGPPEYSVRLYDGSPFGMLDRAHLDELVQAGVLDGRGSKNQIRFFQFATSDWKSAVQQHIETVRQQRRPIDLLAKMMAARSFTFRQVFAVQMHDGRTARAMIYQHKAVRA